MLLMIELIEKGVVAFASLKYIMSALYSLVRGAVQRFGASYDICQVRLDGCHIL